MQILKEREENWVAESYPREFLGHHTCSNKNGREYVRTFAPFWAEFDQEKEKYQFLGAGYYFWDDNEAMAHNWGAEHYRGKYCVLVVKLSIPNNLLLDLAGDRQDMRYIHEVVEMFKEKIPQKEGPALGSVIEFLKKISERGNYEGIFPFESIRAVDSTPRGLQFQGKMNFTETNERYTLLNPRIIICVNDKKNPILV